MRRPENAAVRNSTPSCSDADARTRAQTSSGENTWMSPRRPHRMLLDARQRIDRHVPDDLGSPEDAVQLDQQLVLAAIGQTLQRPTPDLDLLGRDRLELSVAECRQQVRPQRRLVVDQRRRLALAVLSDEAQPLLGGLGELDAAPDHAGQRAASSRVQDVFQPSLGLAPREVAGGRPTAFRPGRADLLLDLPPVRQPVLRVPDRTPRPLDAEDMPGRWLQRGHSRPNAPPARDIFGTYFARRSEAGRPDRAICSAFPMPPVGIEPTTFGLKVRCSAS